MVPFQGEAQREVVTAEPWVQSQIVTVPIPRDTSIRAISIRLSGSMVVTWASALTVIQTSSFDALVSRIDLRAEGGRIIKSVRPWIQGRMQLLRTGVLGERKCSTAAAAAYANNPTIDAGFTAPTSTETSTIAESIYLSMEMWLADDEESQQTILHSRGLNSLDLQLVCTTPSSLEVTSNGTFSSVSLTFSVSVIESPFLSENGVPARQWDWKETVNVKQLSAQVTDQVIPLPTGNLVAGIAFLTVQDSTGADGTAANRKKPNSNVITNIRFRKNGQEFFSASYAQLQAQNRLRWGVTAPFSSNVSPLDGFAYVDFLRKGKLNTALDLRDKMSTFEMLVTTRAAVANNMVYPVDLTYQVGELVRVR